MLLALCLLTVVGFGVGVGRLFNLRFEVGDIYPRYSSLRSDPLGCRGLYDSLKRLPDLRVERNYRPLAELGTGSGTTLLFPGISFDSIGPGTAEMEGLLRFVASGGRLVVTFSPVRPRSSKERDDHEAATSSDNRVQDEQPSPESECFDSMAEKWGIREERIEMPIPSEPARRQDGTPAFLPAAIPWHTALYFEFVEGDWKTIYRVREWPVVVQRTYGGGMVVFAADSYIVSNEAMVRDRQPGLLAWLIGSNPRIVFDETHLGVRRQPGIAMLARRYRLHGLFGGLVLLALLFIWKHAVPFVPPVAGAVALRGKKGGFQVGSNGGMVSLMQRHIPSKSVLSLCVDVYERSLGGDRDKRAAGLSEIRRLLNAAIKANQDPVALYRTICRFVAKEKQL